MTTNYGFTIKCIEHDIYADSLDLDVTMLHMLAKHKAIYVEHFYEKDSLGRLHIHGSFLARKGIRLNLFKRPFYTIHIDHLKEVADVERWAKYIRKSQVE